MDQLAASHWRREREVGRSLLCSWRHVSKSTSAWPLSGISIIGILIDCWQNKLHRLKWGNWIGNWHWIDFKLSHQNINYPSKLQSSNSTSQMKPYKMQEMSSPHPSPPSETIFHSSTRSQTEKHAYSSCRSSNGSWLRNLVILQRLVSRSKLCLVISTCKRNLHPIRWNGLYNLLHVNLLRRRSSMRHLKRNHFTIHRGH